MKHMESYMLFKYLLKQQLVRKPVRLLGLHIAAKHVGVAVADVDIAHAEPYCVMHRKDSESIAQSFRHLLREESVKGILVGVPVDAEDNPDFTPVNAFMKELPKIAELKGVRVAVWKDFLTVSQDVEYLLTPYQLDQKITTVFGRSAAAVLQDYLDDVTSPTNLKFQDVVLDDS